MMIIRLAARLRLACMVAVVASLAAALTGCGGGDSGQDFSCAANAQGAVALARCTAKVGDLIEVALVDVKPTQPSLGYDEVYYKLGRYGPAGKDAINKRFADWCEANGQLDAAAAPTGATIKDAKTFTCKLALGSETDESKGVMKTAVIGPKGIPYLTDGHHTFTSLAETPDGGMNVRVRVRVQANLGDMSESAFWAEMEKRQFTWLRDTNDKPITPQQLPTSVGIKNFANDPYRGVLYFARDIGYEQRPDNATFLEFYWGKWLRSNASIDFAGSNLNDLTSYLALVEKISKAQAALADTDVVSEGKTAQQLGKLATWDSKGEMVKLSQPYSASKPGKIAYALEYKKALP
jgi:hypothetical protein